MFFNVLLLCVASTAIIFCITGTLCCGIDVWCVVGSYLKWMSLNPLVYYIHNIWTRIQKNIFFNISSSLQQNLVFHLGNKDMKMNIQDKDRDVFLHILCVCDTYIRNSKGPTENLIVILINDTFLIDAGGFIVFELNVSIVCICWRNWLDLIFKDFKVIIFGIGEVFINMCIDSGIFFSFLYLRRFLI